MFWTDSSVIVPSTVVTEVAESCVPSFRLSLIVIPPAPVTLAVSELMFVPRSMPVPATSVALVPEIRDVAALATFVSLRILPPAVIVMPSYSAFTSDPIVTSVLATIVTSPSFVDASRVVMAAAVVTLLDVDERETLAAEVIEESTVRSPPEARLKLPSVSMAARRLIVSVLPVVAENEMSPFDAITVSSVNDCLFTTVMA